MASGETVIQSMWSPAVTKVRAQGVPCTYQPLKEGYRAWASGFGIPKTLSGRKLDAAYDFINWFLSGWAGPTSTGRATIPPCWRPPRRTCSPTSGPLDGGQARREGHSGSRRHADREAGATRDGGSFDARMGAVACWNAVMDENTYMVRKWNEFIAA